MISDAFPIVLHRPGFHLYPVCHQVIPVVDGGDTIEHMVARLLDVVRHHILKGEHPLGVQVAGAGDEVLLVGVLRRQLVADEMAPVVEAFPLHTVIAHRVPAGGFDLADVPPFFCGHQISADVGVGGGTPSQLVQLAIALKGGGGVIRRRKIGDVVVHLHIRGTVIGGGRIVHLGAGGVLFGLAGGRLLFLAAGERQTKERCQQQRHGFLMHVHIPPK